MSVLVKNLTNGMRTATYKDAKGLPKKVVFEPGRNRISDELWDAVKGTDFIKLKLRKDELTVSTHTEESEVIVAIDPLDPEVLEGFIGKDDAKEYIQEYADAWGIKLNPRKTSVNMIADLKAEHAELDK